MTPIDFEERNNTYAKDQPEYLPLPVMKFPDGTALSCWQMSPDELEEVNRNGGKVYVQHYTQNKPLQPLMLATVVYGLYPQDYEPLHPETLKIGDSVFVSLVEKSVFGMVKVTEVTQSYFAGKYKEGTAAFYFDGTCFAPIELEGKAKAVCKYIGQ